MWWDRNKVQKEDTVDLISSLQCVVKEERLDITTVNIALTKYTQGQQRPCVQDRFHIWLEDANARLAEWHISSLKELFRGTKEPPKDMDHYPEEYCEIFFAIEQNVLIASEFSDDVRDDEMAGLYSLMKRCPDGRSEGFLHDVIYQSAALVLGLQPISRAEFEAVFDQLANSVRSWRESHSSKNYIFYLQKNFLGVAQDNPGRDILLEKIKNADYLPKKTIIVESANKGWKMSEVLIDFARPLLDAAENAQAMEKALTLAIVVWNASLLPEASQKDMIQKIVEATSSSGFKEDEEIGRSYVDMLLKRKRSYFSHCQRMIAEWHFEKEGDDLHLNVASVPSNGETKELLLAQKPTPKSLLAKIRQRFWSA